MEEYIDINKELERKNEEMFLNKKKIDLDTSMESLMVFYDNYCKTITNEINDHICLYHGIKSDSENSKVFFNTITSFFFIVNKKLSEIINNNIEPVKSKLDTITDLEYANLLNQISNTITENLKEYYIESAAMLSSELNQDVDEDIKNSINKYIYDILTIKMINVFKDKFAFSVKVISNNYEANKEIIENINEKTLK